MRKLIFGGALVLCATVLLASGTLKPLDVKTGLWETTTTTTMKGLPPIPAARMTQMTPEQRAQMEAAIEGMSGKPMTYTGKNCVTREDLNKNPFDDRKCHWTVLTSTGSKIEARGTGCTMGKNRGMEVSIHVVFEALDSEHVKGTGEVTMSGNGHTMNSNFTTDGKWVGPTCPADLLQKSSQ